MTYSIPATLSFRSPDPSFPAFDTLAAIATGSSSRSSADIQSDSLTSDSLTEDVIAAAIAGVIQRARIQGQSLEDIVSEVLQEDSLLDARHRHWLSEVVELAWNHLPEGDRDV